MTADILTNIHNKLTTFSKGQRRIATYILESYDKAAFLTAGALGKITQVSESTVVRFAAELGYDGYPAMQRALQEMVLNRLTSVQRIEVTDERLGEQDVVSTILQADMDRLRHTNEHLDREAFSGAVEALLQARCIYVLGVRTICLKTSDSSRRRRRARSLSSSSASRRRTPSSASASRAIPRRRARRCSTAARQARRSLP